MNALAPIIHDLKSSPAAGYRLLAERVHALLSGFSPLDRAEYLAIRTIALQWAGRSPEEAARKLRALADELETR